MLSIFIMFSNDRQEALNYTIACLKNMDGYKDCQKTLIIDGFAKSIPEDWQIVQVPRINGKFCWAKMWDAGVFSSIHEKIIYLDSDRLLPTNYLSLVDQYLDDDIFMFTSKHFMMVEKLPLELCQEILKIEDIGEILSRNDIIGKLRYEPRSGEIIHGPGKNVMSGSTAFTKKTYMKLGGVDHWYCGHGAYADTDFQMQACNSCLFVDTKLTELHYFHTKIENDKILDVDELKLLSLNNFIYYCYKWNVPHIIAENLAINSNISRQYVKDKFKEFSMVS